MVGKLHPGDNQGSLADDQLLSGLLDRLTRNSEFQDRLPASDVRLTSWRLLKRLFLAVWPASRISSSLSPVKVSCARVCLQVRCIRNVANPESPLQVESAKVHLQSSWRCHYSILLQPPESDFSIWTLPDHPFRECLGLMANQFISLRTDGFPYTQTGSGD